MLGWILFFGLLGFVAGFAAGVWSSAKSTKEIIQEKFDAGLWVKKNCD